MGEMFAMVYNVNAEGIEQEASNYASGEPVILLLNVVVVVHGEPGGNLRLPSWGWVICRRARMATERSVLFHL